MISKRDSKPFLIKFPVGTLKTNKTEMQYEKDWKTVYGLVSDPSGAILSRVYGNEHNFDKVIIVNAGSLTRAINYGTIFMLDEMPTSNYPVGDYYPKYIYPEYNGEIVIGLKRVEGLNHPKLYFFIGDDVLYCQINYDKETRKAYIGSKQIIPFSVGDFVWTRTPTDKESSASRLKFSSKEKTGFDDRCKTFYELTFEKE